MPAVTFGGIGSGMDVEGLIEGLVNVARAPLSRIQSKAASARAAKTSISELGGLLSELKSAASGLDTFQKVGSYAATSSNESALSISASGNAVPGSYDVEVLQLARAARRYTNAYDSVSQGLGENGTLTIQVGTGDLQDPDGNVLVGAATLSINLNVNTTLGDVVNAINESDLRVQASTMFDGSQYRLMIRGLDVGADNLLTIDQTGVTLGLNEEDNIIHHAQNALMTVDGFQVESTSNTVSGAISGVTMTLLEETVGQPFTIDIATDPEGLAGKLDTFISSFNTVVKKVHTLAGFGDTKATNPYLSGDGTLRGITNQLSRTLSTTFGSGKYNTLASLGISLNNDGTLKLDRSKLDTAMGEDQRAVSDVLAGTDDSGGMMDLLRDLAESLTDPIDGSLAIREDGLDSRASAFDDQIAREEERLVRMEERLRKTFTEMDGTVASYNAQLQYLLNNA